MIRWFLIGFPLALPTLLVTGVVLLVFAFSPHEEDQS